MGRLSSNFWLRENSTEWKFKGPACPQWKVQNPPATTVCAAGASHPLSFTHTTTYTGAAFGGGLGPDGVAAGRRAPEACATK